MGTLRRWLVIAVALVTTTIVIGVIMPSFGLLAPHWGTSFGASNGSIMMATALTQIGAGLFAPIVGYAVGRISIRTLMVFGVTLTSVSLALVASATQMWQVTALHAVALSACIILCGPLVTQVLAVRLFQENRGLAIGVVTAGAPICSFTMPPLIGYLLTQFDWRMVELLMAGLILALAPLIWFVVRENPAALVDENAPEAVPEPTLTSRDILRNWMFWGVLLAVVPVNLVFNAIYYNIGFYLADLGYGSAETATMISVIGIVSLPAVLAFGAMVDHVKPWPLMAVTVFFSGVSAAMAVSTQSYAFLMVSLALMGFCLGGFGPLIASIFARRFGAVNFAQANGLIAPFVTLTAFSPMLAGYVRDMSGSYSVAFTMLLASFPLALIGVLMMRPPARVAEPVPAIS